MPKAHWATSRPPALRGHWSLAIAAVSSHNALTLLPPASIVRAVVDETNLAMNTKLLLKTLFSILILLLLVLMGMHNRGLVDFTLPPLLKETIKQPAALMYFAFFAIGVITGTVMTAGTGKKGGTKAVKGGG